MEFLRKTKLDADLPTKTKKGEEETEVGEKKGEVIGHVGRRRGRGGKKRMGGNQFIKLSVAVPCTGCIQAAPGEATNLSLERNWRGEKGGNWK